jgi:aspartyl-tRNA(Asn)/glutamyl-tRNA(Gln) amidotransferase subunit A
VVERLRQAGAVILGKTVTTPYAYLDPPPTRNPWDLSRTPGGSSSGSAAAVACGMCLASVGTQTGGSITRPASYCGVASLKPTHGWISRDGVLPLAPTLDHVGFMARTVYDLAVLFCVTAGRDDREPDCWADPHADVMRTVREALDPKFDQFFEFATLGGIFREQASPLMRSTVEAVEHCLKRDARCDSVVASVPAGFDAIPEHNHAIYATEAAVTHGERLARHPDDYPPKLLALVEEGLRVDGVRYAAAKQFRHELERTNYNVAAPTPYLTPATVDLPPGLETTGSPLFNSPWSFLGYPTISLPAFWWEDDGLPTAIQLVGGRQCEAELFAHAATAERVLEFKHRLPPVPA